MGRKPCCEMKGLRKGAWNREEDEILAAYIQKEGPGNWRNVPKKAGLLRCGKSCRFRWMNYLRPDVKRGKYSKEEEEIIIKLHELYGNRWSMIAAALPGRTDNEIKNVWHTHLKNRPKKDGMTQKTSQFTQEEPEFNAETTWDYLSFRSDADVLITPRSESSSSIPWCQQQSSCEFSAISSNSSNSNVVIAENLIDGMREEFCKYGWPDISWSENSVMENEFLPIMFVDLYPQESFGDFSSINSSSLKVVGQNHIGLSETTEEFFENVWSKSFWTENSVMGVIDCQ